MMKPLQLVKLKKYTYNTYACLFSAPWFINFNKLLFQLSLRGLGVLNYETKYLTGEVHWLKKYLSNFESPVVFDVGANVGDYSNEILKLFSNAIIYAFEPHPKNFVQLQSLGYGRIHCFNNAVGDRPGHIQLYDYENNDGTSHASLYQEVIEKIHHEKSVSHAVSLITLDGFCAEHSVARIDLLKLDTEGNELKCLIGAQQLLRENKIKAVQFEFNNMNIISRSPFKDFWDLLEGFNFYRLLPGGRLLEMKSYSPLSCEIYAYQNIVALKRT